MDISFDVSNSPIRINSHSINRFSIHQKDDLFFLHDKEQFYLILEKDDIIIIQGWKNYNPSPPYHPFSPRSIKLSPKEIILKIIQSESSIMKNHSCKIIQITNGQRFILLKNKNGILLHHYLDG